MPVFKPFVLALLASSALSLPASAGTWNFRYEGFAYDISTGEDHYAGFGGGYAVAGTFSGNDIDQDGVLELDEVSSFFARYPMTGCPTGDFPNCALTEFSYSAEGGLHFASWSEWRYPGTDLGATMSIRSGESSLWRVASGYQLYRDERLTWTPDTTFIITAVPEPSSYLMLGIGVLLLGRMGAQRRRQMPPS